MLDWNRNTARWLSWLVLLTLVGALVSATPVSTVASLTESDASTENPIQAGTVDISLSERGPASTDSTVDETTEDALMNTWHDPEHNDGFATDSIYNTVELTDAASTLSIETIGLAFSFDERDTPNGTQGNGAATARTIQVQTLRYGSTDLLATSVSDENGNGIVDLEDLTLGSSASNLAQVDTPPTELPVALTLELSGNSSASAAVASGDGIVFTLAVDARASSFVDRDTTTQNTITYA